MDAKTKYWIKAVLTNDEVSTDAELIDHFINEGGMSSEEAEKWVALRPQYIGEIYCDAEPDQ